MKCQQGIIAGCGLNRACQVAAACGSNSQYGLVVATLVAFSVYKVAKAANPGAQNGYRFSY
jgi:hypothetical protein